MISRLPFPTNTPTNTPTSTPMPKLHPSEEEFSSLKATILSTYDIPNHMKPKTVQMECFFDVGEGEVVTVESGPPVSRHKDKNAFKFVANDDKKNSSLGKNELVINAPLSQLYSATVIFRVKLDGRAPDLLCQVHLSSQLLINETQWLILNLTESLTTKDMEEVTETTPTLRLKLQLTGSYRPEISKVISLSELYFSTVDHIESSLVSPIQSVKNILPKQVPSAKLLLVPTVPIVTLWVAALPILLGLLIIGLPLFLPFLILVLTILLSFSGVLLTLYYSTENGRRKLLEWLGPLYSSFIATSSGQRFMYDTGPPPTPIQLAKLVVPSEMIPKLLFCLAIDFIGSSSYLMPLLGETTDIVWAPIQAIVVAALFDDISPNLKYLAFVEELLPFTDVIPTATLGWLKEFGPGLLITGKDKVEELSIVLRREKIGLENLVNGYEKQD